MSFETFVTLSGWAAALIAGTVAAIQFYIGRKQAEAALTSAKAALMNAQNAGRHKVADFRQRWINNVIDAISEHLAVVVTAAGRDDLTPEEEQTIVASRTRLEILLNPKEKDTIALLSVADEILEGETLAQRRSSAKELVQIARKLLKREWVRIKKELTSEPT